MASFPSPRSQAEVTAVLEDFERRHRAFELTVQGISLWRILRFEISLTMQNLGLSRPMASKHEILASLLSAAGQFLVAPRGIQRSEERRVGRERWRRGR